MIGRNSQYHRKGRRRRKNRAIYPSTVLNLRAFTLIELLVVVSIVALLITITVPSLRKARNMGKETICKTNLRSIYLAQSLFLDVRRKFQPLNNEKNDGRWQYNYLINDGRDWKANFGPLVTDKGLLHEIKILYCPFQKHEFHSFDTSENPWPPNDNFDSRSSYGRRHLLSGRARSDFKRNIALFADVIHMPRVIRTAHKWGVNAVYLDGHVSRVPDPGILRNNDLGEPFDLFDNPTVAEIWRAIDRHQ